MVINDIIQSQRKCLLLQEKLLDYFNVSFFYGPFWMTLDGFSPLWIQNSDIFEEDQQIRQFVVNFENTFKWTKTIKQIQSKVLSVCPRLNVKILYLKNTTHDNIKW